MKLVRAVALAWLALAGATEESSGGGGSRVAKSTGPPAFFLQDPTDGLCTCLSGVHTGTEFKRCAIGGALYCKFTQAWAALVAPPRDDG